jgi:hypothetical protein
MKVRVGEIYTYQPALLDSIDPRTSLRRGDRVRVVNLPGCPRANTMRHCHVETLDGQFIGLVQTASLR